MNDLTITVDFTKGEGIRDFLGTRPIIHSPIVNVVVKFCYRINGARSFRSIIVSMEARDRSQGEEGLRCELLQSATSWMEGEWFMEENPGDPGDEWTIRTIDPDGVLKWLGIDFETFKKYQKNDQPLRLPAPPVK